MAIPSRQIGWGTEENLLWQISKQLETLTKVTYNIGQTTTTTTTLSPNCIEFVVNTTNSTFFTFNFSTEGPINFTIDWGDGTTHPDSGYGGYYEEQHTYSQENQEYTVRVCFDNIAAVRIINFPGND
jgi:hypothetical protein